MTGSAENTHRYNIHISISLPCIDNEHVQTSLTDCRKIPALLINKNIYFHWYVPFQTNVLKWEINDEIISSVSIYSDALLLQSFHRNTIQRNIKKTRNDIKISFLTPVD